MTTDFVPLFTSVPPESSGVTSFSQAKFMRKVKLEIEKRVPEAAAIQAADASPTEATAPFVVTSKASRESDLVEEIVRLSELRYSEFTDILAEQKETSERRLFAFVTEMQQMRQQFETRITALTAEVAQLKAELEATPDKVETGVVETGSASHSETEMRIMANFTELVSSLIAERTGMLRQQAADTQNELSRQVQAMRDEIKVQNKLALSEIGQTIASLGENLAKLHP